MFRKLTVLVCLMSFFPAAVGAQELAALQQSPAAAESTTVQPAAREVDLSVPAARQAATVMAENSATQDQMVQKERPRKTHSGLTFKEFCEVHFGEYRWIYWAIAGAALIAIHVAAKD